LVEIRFFFKPHFPPAPFFRHNIPEAVKKSSSGKGQTVKKNKGNRKNKPFHVLFKPHLKSKMPRLFPVGPRKTASKRNHREHEKWPQEIGRPVTGIFPMS